MKIPAGWSIERQKGGGFIEVTNPAGKTQKVIHGVGVPFIVSTFGATNEEAVALVSSIKAPLVLPISTVDEAIARAGEDIPYVIESVLVCEGNNATIGSASAGKTPLTHKMIAAGFSGNDFLRYKVENKIRRCLYLTAEGERIHGRSLQRYGLGDVLLNLSDVNDRYGVLYSERCGKLAWSEVIEQSTAWLTNGITSGDPAVLVIEIMTDWLTELSEEGENDAIAMTHAFDAIKIARDNAVTPLIQYQSPKYYDRQVRD